MKLPLTSEFCKIRENKASDIGLVACVAVANRHSRLAIGLQVSNKP